LIAREYARSIGVETVEDIREAPDSHFDVAISHHALEHTERPLEVVRAFYSKLRDGGLVVVVVPGERYDTQYNPTNKDKHLYTWSPMNLGNLFDHGGFRVEAVERIPHRWPPKVEVIDRLLGRAACNIICNCYGYLRPKLTQIRIVASKA